jgi:hypothetical protein
VTSVSSVGTSLSGAKGAIQLDDHFALGESPLLKCVIRGCARHQDVVQTAASAALVGQSTTTATATVTVATPVVGTATNKEKLRDRRGGPIKDCQGRVKEFLVHTTLDGTP